VTDWQNAFLIGRNFFAGSKKAARYDSLLQHVLVQHVGGWAIALFFPRRLFPFPSAKKSRGG
jgi:hypothetical protein